MYTVKQRGWKILYYHGDISVMFNRIIAINSDDSILVVYNIFECTNGKLDKTIYRQLSVDSENIVSEVFYPWFAAFCRKEKIPVPNYKGKSVPSEDLNKLMNEHVRDSVRRMKSTPLMRLLEIH